MWDFFRSKPREVMAADRVKEEVRKRKEIAEEKGVKELISELYFSSLQYFPSWIEHSRDYVPILIDSAQSEDIGKKKATIISFKGKKYRFEFSQDIFSTPDNKYYTHGLLELFSNNKKLLAINLSWEDEDDIDASEWRPFGIEAFIDGEWINDFQYLKKRRSKKMIS